MILYFLSIYWCLMVLSCCLAIFRFSRVKMPTKVLCLLIFWGLLSEAVARQVARVSGNNQWVYNIAMLVEWMLVCLYYHFSLSIFKRYRIGLWLILLVLAFSIVNLVNAGVKDLNFSILYGAFVSILLLSVYAVCRFLLLDRVGIVLQRKVHFWVPWLLIFYQGGSLWSWATFPYFSQASKEAALVLQQMLLCNCVIYYTGLVIVLWRYPKLKETYE